MSKDEWFSLNEASRSIGKSKGYFSTTRTRHPEYFQNIELKQVGDTIIISQEGIDEVLKHIKKEGDRLRILPLKAVYKTKHILCFYPTNHYIKIEIN